MSAIATKICRSCEVEQPLENYGVATAREDGLATQCKACRRVVAQRNRENRAAVYRRRQAERYEEARALLADLKSNPCTDCGQTFPWFCMDYDHRDPKTKRRSVSMWLGSGNIKQMLDEIELCDLVCSNCHRIRTFIQAEDGLIHVGRPRKYA